MWFRIELNKDGSIASCAEASPSFPERGGGRIYFIEADTKEAALSMGLRRYREYLESQRQSVQERREKLRRAGVCRDCRGPLEKGRTAARCVACTKRHSRVQAGIEDVGRQGVPRPETIANKNANYRLEILLEVQTSYKLLSDLKFRAWLQQQIEAARSVPRVAAAE